jgi:hypothetical protein
MRGKMANVQPAVAGAQHAAFATLQTSTFLHCVVLRARRMVLQLS